MIFKYRGRFRGGHYQVRVFAGENPDALGKAGDLMLRPSEWASLVELAAQWEAVADSCSLVDVIIVQVIDDSNEEQMYDLPLNGADFG